MAFNFWEVAEYKQQTAKTKEAAVREMRTTCNRCRKAGYCEERSCRIYQVHQLKLLQFETPVSVKFVKVETREYRKDPAMVKRGKAQKVLTRFYNDHSKNWDNSIKARFDDACVLIEDNDYRGALIILRSLWLFNLATHIENILKEDK